MSSASRETEASNEATPTTNFPVGDLDVPKNKRWSKVSGSGNADYRYRVHMKDPKVAYSFITICRLPNYHEDEYEDEDEDEDENEDDGMDGDDDSNTSSKKQPQQPCDGGVTCICDKPVAEHPEHPFIISRAGNHKYFTQRIHLSLRRPDMFDMYVYNDFEAYGVMEVVENLVADWIEAGKQKNWKEQWVIVEAMAMMWASDSIDPMQMYVCPYTVHQNG
jgi:hypothetical protein